MDNEGVALYPLQSWVNHSCVPNCEVKFPEKNHRVGLIATKDIEIGEEIKISYLG
jgi:SET domain-containing protein